MLKIEINSNCQKLEIIKNLKLVAIIKKIQ